MIKNPLPSAGVSEVSGSKAPKNARRQRRRSRCARPKGGVATPRVTLANHAALSDVSADRAGDSYQASRT